MAKFRKKPVVIEAFRWTGGPDQTEDPVWICNEIEMGRVGFRDLCTPQVSLRIDSPEGPLTAMVGDWVVRDALGRIYPMKEAAFLASYEPAE